MDAGLACELAVVIGADMKRHMPVSDIMSEIGGGEHRFLPVFSPELRRQRVHRRERCPGQSTLIDHKSQAVSSHGGIIILDDPVVS